MDVEYLWAECEGQRRTRAANMPTEQLAIDALFEAYLRLKELGWNDAIYAPKDGTTCLFIECGSTGIHRGHMDEEHRVWLHDDGDLSPSHAVLFRQA
jgi:hypothetical protein